MTVVRQVSRRRFLLGLAPALAAARREPGKGFEVDPEAIRFPDPLTERETWRLTDPGVLHHLPHYHHRFISKRGSFLLLASERTGSRQIFRLNLPECNMVQLTSGPDIHSYSPSLDPRERSFFLLQGNALKMVSVRNGREKEIYRCPSDWRFTGHLSISDDSKHAAVIEMKADHYVPGFEELFRRRPRCRIRVVDTRRGQSRVVIEERQWLAHPQFRPGRNDILYCHEGPWGLVEGRLRLTSFDGKQQKNLRPREGTEELGHEYWSGPGHEICYVHYPDSSGNGATVRCLNPETGKERVLSRCTKFGWLMGNRDNSAIIGASRSLAGPNIYVLFTRLKREITICEHASSGKPHPIAGTKFLDPYASWPEPVFSPDSHWIYFTSDRQGRPTLYRVNVEDLVEDTPEVSRESGDF